MTKTLRIALSVLATLAAAFGLHLLWQARVSRDATPALDLDEIVATRRLPACPDLPNCVSSQAVDPDQLVEPFEVDLERESAVGALERLLAAARAEGGEVVTRRDGFAHLVFRSRHLGFVDDVYLVIAREPGRLDVASASRVGSSDFGANRERVETLRDRYVLG